MDRTRILDQIRKNDDLLSLPQVLTQLLESIDTSNLRSDSLANIILKDPALTSRLLRFANSPFYSRYAKTTNVHQAVQVLGFATVKCLALSSSVLNPSRLKDVAHIDARTFFSGILSVAVASEKIARSVSLRSTEETFIAGLLHHIGILFFIHHYPTSYREILEHKIKADSLIEAERMVFGIDHAEVGFNLAQRWNLPKDICAAIGGHHDHQSAVRERSMPNILRLATILCHESIEGFETDPLVQVDQTHRMCDLLGLSNEQLESISVSIMPDTVKLSAFLDTDIGTVEEILARSNREMWRSFLTVQHLFRERQDLNRKLLIEERTRGAMESKNIAIATLSHYINNATTAWYGHIQILRQRLQQGDRDRVLEVLPNSLNVMENSIKKTLAVIAEIKDISPIDDVAFYHMSQAMNIDDRIKKRLESMEIDSETTAPETAGLAEALNSNR